eukprot:8248166-Pyramimonas_sp.AAC.1
MREAGPREEGPDLWGATAGTTSRRRASGGPLRASGDRTAPNTSKTPRGSRNGGQSERRILQDPAEPGLH